MSQIHVGPFLLYKSWVQKKRRYKLKALRTYSIE
jgi:hypothetical protein